MKPMFLVAVLFVCASAHAQTYKCVDQRGVTHYSDKPITNCKSEKIKVQRGGEASEQAATPRQTKTMQEHNRQCARDMQEFSRLAPRQRDSTPIDEARQDRLEKLREQLRNCA